MKHSKFSIASLRKATRFFILTLRNILNFQFIIVILTTVFACTPSQENNSKYRLIHNNDGSDLLWNRWFGERPITIEDVNACVDMVAHSQVTTFMICSGSDFLYYDSKYGRTIGDDLNGTLSFGRDTASALSVQKLYKNHLRLKKEGTDIIRATLTRAKEDGMETFITYRMNDLHFNDTSMPSPILCSDFWMQHPEYWLQDSTQGFNSAGALNFAIKEVRDHKLDIISEQLEKYEMIDGYDLDFMRFIVYFQADSGKYYAPLMTQLVKDIRAKVDEIAKKRGKKILLSARVPITVEACMDKGIDIREWIKLGLFDFITIGIHWTGDPAMPVKKFRKDLGTELKIPLYASVDDGGFRPREFYSHGMLRGAASHALAQGADGIYLFNYYLTEYVASGGDPEPEAGGLVCRIRTPQLLQEIGKLETLEGRNKSYSISDGRPQYCIKSITDLPLKVANENATAKIFIGDKMKKKPQEVVLFFRADHDVPLQISINGTTLKDAKPDYTNLYDRNRGLQNEEKEFAYTIPVTAIKSGDNDVSFKAETDTCTILRLEIALKYGDVKTYGYF